MKLGSVRNFHILTFAFALTGLLPVSAWAQKAYITNYDDNTVSVIDTTTNTVVKTIPVGLGPFGVAVSPDGARTYVTNYGNQVSSSNSVSVIDTATDIVIAAIPVGSYPFGVAVTPDNTKVYVTNTASASVSVIDTATNTVSKTIIVGTACTNFPNVPSGEPGFSNCQMPIGVAVSPDGTEAWVGRKDYFGNDDYIFVIQTKTDTGVATIDIGSGVNPQGIAFTPDGTKAYLGIFTGSGPGPDVLVINAVSHTVITGIPQPAATTGVAITPDGKTLYVIHPGGFPWMSMVDTATNTIITSITTPGGPGYGLSKTPDGSRVYAVNPNNPGPPNCAAISTTSGVTGCVTVIDTSTNTVTGSIPVGVSPVAFGNFIQPKQRFAGTPADHNCHGQTVSALSQKYGGLSAAATALGYANVTALQDAITSYCGGAQAPSISPVSGPVGTQFVIKVPAGTMQQTDICLFYLSGTNPANGTLVNNAVISSDGSTLTGSVPVALNPGSYFVTVRPNIAGSADFNDVAFQVTL
jgi:YVTN family beta-propeller protein